MGYTHYFEQIDRPDDKQWKDLIADFKRLYASSLLTSPLPIQREADMSGPPHADDQAIIFNGIGDKGYETFYLPRDSEFKFLFCKTSNKPYDLAVMATLLLVHHHMPHRYSIRSDGVRDDWKPAQDFIKALLNIHIEIPEGIRE